MRILFLDSIETGVYGGMEEWIRLVALGLSGRGHEVVIVGRPQSAFIERLKQHGELTLAQKNLSGDFNPVTIASLRKLIKQHGIELVCVNFNRDVRLGGLAAKLGGHVRVVWSVGLDITSDKFIHRQLTPRLVDGVIVPSEALKKQITAKGYLDPDGVTVIPIGIDDVQANREAARAKLLSNFAIADDEVVCATVGRFVEQKGHQHLISAAKDIVEALPSVKFLWFGDGPLEGDLRKQIESENLTGHFVFAGMRDDVADLLPGCDCMIHPSIEEPFGIAVLEGMRAGLPVVASGVGGIPEVVKDGQTALLVPSAQPKLLAETVKELLRDKEKTTAFGLAGRRRWQEYFQLESMIDRIEAYFVEMRHSEKVNG